MPSLDTAGIAAGPGAYSIEVLDAPAVRAARDGLTGLLADAVQGGASLGFMADAERGALAAYWDEVAADVADGDRVCLSAWDGARLIGVVLLAPCGKPNQSHRADVQKLLVHRDARRRGVGGALMRALEREALARGRWLLILDTRTASDADNHYRTWGWTPFGTVPGFAYDPDGTLADCTFHYKRLPGAPT